MNLEQKIIDLLNWCIFKQWDYAKRFSFRPDCLGCEMIEFCCRSEQRLKAELDQVKSKLSQIQEHSCNQKVIEGLEEKLRIAVEALERLSDVTKEMFVYENYKSYRILGKLEIESIAQETLRKIKAINLDV